MPNLQVHGMEKSAWQWGEDHCKKKKKNLGRKHMLMTLVKTSETSGASARVWGLWGQKMLYWHAAISSCSVSLTTLIPEAEVFEAWHGTLIFSVLPHDVNWR